MPPVIRAMSLAALGATVPAWVVVLGVLAVARRGAPTWLGAACVVLVTGAPIDLAHTAASALAWDAAPTPAWHPFVVVLALRAPALLLLARWRHPARATLVAAGAAAVLGTLAELAAWTMLGPR